MNLAPITAIASSSGFRKKSLLAHDDGLAFAVCIGPNAEDYAARLALCWNACLGVPTCELRLIIDDGGLAGLLERETRLIDELAAAPIVLDGADIAPILEPSRDGTTAARGHRNFTTK